MGSRSAARCSRRAVPRSRSARSASLARVGTYDATNSFKAYSTDFVREVGIDSRSGFEIGLELTAKARRLRRPVAELPTIWLDRTIGESHFDLTAWIPKYLRWYRVRLRAPSSPPTRSVRSPPGSPPPTRAPRRADT